MFSCANLSKFPTPHGSGTPSRRLVAKFTQSWMEVIYPKHWEVNHETMGYINK